MTEPFPGPEEARPDDRAAFELSAGDSAHGQRTVAGPVDPDPTQTSPGRPSAGFASTDPASPPDRAPFHGISPGPPAPSTSALPVAGGPLPRAPEPLDGPAPSAPGHPFGGRAPSSSQAPWAQPDAGRSESAPRYAGQLPAGQPYPTGPYAQPYPPGPPAGQPYPTGPYGQPYPTDPYGLQRSPYPKGGVPYAAPVLTPVAARRASSFPRLIAGLALLLLVFAAGYVVGSSGVASGPSGTASAPPSLVAVAPPTTAPGATTTAPGTTNGDPSAQPTQGNPTPAATSDPTPAGPGATVPPDAPADFNLYWQALQIVRDNFVDPSKLTDQNLVYGSIRGMVDALGDTGHSVFLTPDDLKAEQQDLSGTITGIGVLINDTSGSPVIVSVIDGSPALAAGLRTGDVIVAVDGTAVASLSSEQVISKIRGPAGTTVVLTIRHAGDTQTEDVTITRANITVPAVTWAMVPGTTIADIRVVQFSTGAAASAKQAIQDATAAGAQKIVLDLRGDPGGYVNEAVDLASQFVGSGTIYEEKDRAGNVKPIPATPGGLATSVPLVVLVDQGSASSSEICAGAIQGNNRGQLVGTTTFGTGTVLNTFNLPDGSAIRVGVLEWLTPTGQTIFGHGITPDVKVDLPNNGSIVEPTTLKTMTPAQFGASTDTQLQKAVQLLGQ